MPERFGHVRDPLPFWRPTEGFLLDAVWFGMSTRLGGVSACPYATLNLGLRVGDIESAVEENRRRFRAAAGIPERGLRMVRQVHGSHIVGPDQGPVEADGLLVAPGDPWVAITAADCAAVAVVAEDGSAAALLHCGWRGAQAEIGRAAVELLRARGIRPEALLAAIGPCLHACCFPVGPEVASRFRPDLLRPHSSGQPSLDLPRAIETTLAEAGVPPDRIDVSPECTSCERERYYSHRRDRGVTGRHWALLRLARRP